MKEKIYFARSYRYQKELLKNGFKVVTAHLDSWERIILGFEKTEQLMKKVSEIEGGKEKHGIKN